MLTCPLFVQQWGIEISILSDSCPLLCCLRGLFRCLTNISSPPLMKAVLPSFCCPRRSVFGQLAGITQARAEAGPSLSSGVAECVGE